MTVNSSEHRVKSARLLGSSFIIWVVLLACNYYAQTHFPHLLPFIIIVQGLWLYRLYAVAHEASHRKLFPEHRLLNDAAGNFAMMWVWAPISIFRHIHNFHHGANRRASGIATLDTVVVRNRMFSWLHYINWYLLVFAGGFFFHTLISILLFLVLPQRLGKNISPAFHGWLSRKRLVSWAEFSCSVGLHGTIFIMLGAKQWLWLIGYPVAAFAWLWSVMLYIYHYRTTIGRKVQFNVRSLPHMPFFSWLLLNFNHHSAHHSDPNIPWYQLPFTENPQPEEIRLQNQNVNTLRAAVTQQLKGPRIIVQRSSGAN